MPKTARACHRSRTGIILIVVLIVIVALALAAYTFSDTMQLERRASLNAGQRLQARLCAESGIAYVESVIQNRHADRNRQTLDDPEQFRRVEIEPGNGLPAGQFSVVAPIDGSEPSYGLVNLSGRININSLVYYEEDVARHALLQLPEMSHEIADAILDWIDEDDRPRQHGAESSYYQSLNPGYCCSNRPLRSLDELLLVRDVTYTAVYGRDQDRNGRIDQTESDGSQTNTDDTVRWCQWLTTESGESNLRRDGQPRIDINGPDLATLFDTLESEFGAGVAKLVVGYRLYGPFPTPPDQPGNVECPPQNMGVQMAVMRQGMVLNFGPRHSIRSVFELIGVTIGFVDPTGDLIHSPWTEADSSEQLADFEDAVTTISAPRIPGRINVLHAAGPVLAGIPGMSEVAAQSILEFRTVKDHRHDSMSLAQLLGQANLDLETMRKVAPFLTTGGDVYAGQVIGQMQQGRAFCRLEFTIDATGRVPRLRRCRDLSALGRGL